MITGQYFFFSFLVDLMKSFARCVFSEGDPGLLGMLGPPRGPLSLVDLRVSFEYPSPPPPQARTLRFVLHD